MLEDFRTRVLNIVLDRQLRGESWIRWAERLRALRVDPEEQREFLVHHAAWAANMQQKKAAKAVNREKHASVGRRDVFSGGHAAGGEEPPPLALN